MATADRTRPGRHWPGFLSLGGLLWLAAASAQAPAARDYLARMDRNGDGRVALAEYQDWLCYAFDAMDRDHDGTLSTRELPGGRGAALTRVQHRARLAQAFAQQDHDHDGALDAAELMAPPR